MPADVATGLRAWARGAVDQEAGVELLIRAFGGQFAQAGCPWIRRCERRDVFYVDATALINYFDVVAPDDRAVLSIAVALLDARPVTDLGLLLASMPRRELRLVLAALAHAAGRRAQLVHRGELVVFVTAPTAVAWPTDERRAA